MKISIIYYAYKMNLKTNLLKIMSTLSMSQRNEIKRYGYVQLYLYLY